MVNTTELLTGTSSGSQTTTQSPQTSTQASSLGQSQNVQLGTATSLLISHRGIPLNSPQVPTVNFASTTASTAPPPPTATHHTPNPLLLGFSGLLLIVAIVLFWTTSRTPSVKSTTKTT